MDLGCNLIFIYVVAFYLKTKNVLLSYTLAICCAWGVKGMLYLRGGIWSESEKSTVWFTNWHFFKDLGLKLDFIYAVAFNGKCLRWGSNRHFVVYLVLQFGLFDLPGDISWEKLKVYISSYNIIHSFISEVRIGLYLFAGISSRKPVWENHHWWLQLLLCWESRESFFKLTRKRSDAKRRQMRISFDTQSKIVLLWNVLRNLRTESSLKSKDDFFSLFAYYTEHVTRFRISMPDARCQMPDLYWSF